ncbi:MAG: helix-turn-helix domain-containing protein [Pseudomonadota bacterium]
MPTLPVPIFSSLVLGFLLVRIVLVDRRHGALAALLALCAVQGVVIALVQHYGVSGMRPAQAILAACIPPMAWVAFQATAVRGLKGRDAAHLLAPGSALLGFLVWPSGLDVLIPALFVFYGGAILWVSTRGPDALPRLRLGEGALPGLIWTIIGASLIGSALSDVLIIAVMAFGADEWRPWIISIYSSAMLLLVGGLSLSGALNVSASEPEEADPNPPQATEQDAAIVARLDALMRQERLYLDPDLTLTRLARRLVLPVKQVSAAVNKVTGENVSRYINAARIAAAQEALGAGESVTQAMLASGFSTKSNFNREFLRITGAAPRDWRAAQAGR